MVVFYFIRCGYIWHLKWTTISWLTVIFGQQQQSYSILDIWIHNNRSKNKKSATIQVANKSNDNLCFSFAYFHRKKNKVLPNNRFFTINVDNFVNCKKKWEVAGNSIQFWEKILRNSCMKFLSEPMFLLNGIGQSLVRFHIFQLFFCFALIFCFWEILFYT